MMAALERMAKIVAESDQGQTAADSAAYKGDTVSVPLSPSGAARRLYVQVGATNPTRVAFPIDDLNAMTAYIKRAAAKIRDLERDERSDARSSGSLAGDVGGPDMAPHTPRRSSRPGKAGALLDSPTGPSCGGPASPALPRRGSAARD